jgi:hypothetical protein
LTSLLLETTRSSRSTVIEEVKWVLDELTLPGTVAAVWEIWWGTRAQNRKPRTIRIRNSKW